MQEQFDLNFEGVVLANDPPWKLSYTFELIKDNPLFFGPVEGRFSRVVFTLESKGEMVRQTLTHDPLNQEGRRLIAQGLPMGLSGLRSLLEGKGSQPNGEIIFRKARWVVDFPGARSITIWERESSWDG